jgi:hypothetical protein
MTRVHRDAADWRSTRKLPAMSHRILWVKAEPGSYSTSYRQTQHHNLIQTCYTAFSSFPITLYSRLTRPHNATASVLESSARTLAAPSPSGTTTRLLSPAAPLSTTAGTTITASEQLWLSATARRRSGWWWRGICASCVWRLHE